MHFFLSLLLFTWFSWAQEIEVPALTSPVMDEAQLLSEAERADLSSLAYEIYTHQGPQITILTVPTLNGFAIEDYSIKVAEKWKLGLKEKGNGLLILVARDDHKMRIEVGNGIEGEVTDYDSNKYIRELMAPAFREGKYYEGLRLVMQEIAAKFNIKDEENPKFVRRAPQRQAGPLNGVFPFLIIAFVISQILGRRNALARGIFGGAGVAGAAWFLIPGIGLGILFLFIIGFLLGLVGLTNLLFAASAGRGGGGGFGGGFGGGGGGWGGGGGGFSGGGSSGSW